MERGHRCLQVLAAVAAAVAMAGCQALRPTPSPRSYYVAPGGDNTSPGTRAQPFRDISCAARLARPGDTVIIRAGVYREKVVPQRSGKPGRPITFTAHEGETVVVTAADPVTDWMPVTGDINGDGKDDADVWQAQAPWDAGENRTGNTLFVDGKLKFEARQGADDDPLEFSNWGQIPQHKLTRHGFTAPDLRGWGDGFWNGAIVRHQVTDWSYRDSVIADYRSDDGRITFTEPLKGTSQKHVLGYTIYGTIRTLDRPGEWYKDRDTGTLYYQAQAAQNPNDLTIGFKKRDYCFDVRGRSHIHIRGIVCRGGTIQTDDNTHHNVWNGNRIYAYDKGGFGRAYILGSNNTFRDNEVSQSWGAVATIGGTHQQIVNNYFHDIGYVPIARVVTMGGSDHLVSHNTVRKFARSFLDGFPLRSEFAHNLFEDGGKMSWDTGVFDGDAGRGNGGGCIVHHNVIRHVRTIGIYMAFYSGVDLTFHHNIVYDFDATTTMRTGFRTFLNYYHNTFIGPEPLTAFGDTPLNSGYLNNIQLTTDRVGDLGMACRGNHNYSKADFVDFGGGDFRLREGSPAIDRGVVLPGINDGYQGHAPDAGALEYGEPMFEFGHNLDNPPDPDLAWFPVPGTSLDQNGQFNQSPREWTLHGPATWANVNTWNGSGLGRQGNHNIRLQPTGAMTRTFAGLQPDTWYTVGTEIRLVDRRIQAEAFGHSNREQVNSASHRGETYIDGLAEGDWVRYDAVDFGFPGRYDQMELQYTLPASVGALKDDTAHVAVRLNSPTGPLLGTFGFNPLAQDSWFLSRIDIPDATGTQTVFVILSGTGIRRLRLGNVRLLSTNVQPEHQVTVVAENHGGPPVIGHMGLDRWTGRYDSISFKTGPAATRATISFRNTGAYDAYVDSFILFEGAPKGSDAVPSGTVARGERSWQVDLGRLIGVAAISMPSSPAARGGLGGFTLSLHHDDPRHGGRAVWERNYTATASPAAGRALFVNGLDRSSDGTTLLAEVKARYVRITPVAPGSAALGTVRVFAHEAGDLVTSDAEVFETESAWKAVFPQVVDLGQIQVRHGADSPPGETRGLRISVWDRDPTDGGKPIWQRSYPDTGRTVSDSPFIVTGDELADDGVTRLASAIGRCVQIENPGGGKPAIDRVVLRSAALVRPTTNLALQGEASQSLDLYSKHGKADTAINSVVFPLRDFTSTRRGARAWWEVKLEHASAIDQIVLFNRVDAAHRLGEFRVSVLDTGRREVWGRDYSYARGDLPAGGSLTINDDISDARFVRVQLKGKEILSLPEVQVWAGEP